MSKSLKNFKTLRYQNAKNYYFLVIIYCYSSRRDIVSKPSDARAFRFMVVTAQVDFTQ